MLCYSQVKKCHFISALTCNWLNSYSYISQLADAVVWQLWFLWSLALFLLHDIPKGINRLNINWATPKLFVAEKTSDFKLDGFVPDWDHCSCFAGDKYAGTVGFLNSFFLFFAENWVNVGDVPFSLSSPEKEIYTSKLDKEARLYELGNVHGSRLHQNFTKLYTCNAILQVLEEFPLFWLYFEWLYLVLRKDLNSAFNGHSNKET